VIAEQDGGRVGIAPQLLHNVCDRFARAARRPGRYRNIHRHAETQQRFVGARQGLVGQREARHIWRVGVHHTCNIGAFAVDAGVHAGNLARHRVHAALHDLAVEGDDRDVLRRQVRVETRRGQQHMLGAGQPHTHIAMPAVRHDPRLKQPLNCLDKLHSQ